MIHYRALIGAARTWLQARYIVVFAAFLVNAIFYLMRVNLSVAIVAIALDPDKNDSADGQPNDVPHYPWTAAERSTILSSFFWGYTAMQIPALLLVKRFGPKRLVFVMTLLSSAATILFVPAAGLGWKWACASRVLLGFSQSGLMCSIHQLLARWAPSKERGRMVVYAYCGHQVGTVIALAGSGVLSELVGWPCVFYISGAFGLMLAAAWLLLVADSPAEHHMISPRERRYIESGTTDVDGSQQLKGLIKSRRAEKRLKTPWRAIFTSPPFWSLLASQCAQGWGFWTLLTVIPSYMNGVLDFNLAEDGLLSSLPYAAMWGTSLVLGWAADVMLKRGAWSVGTSRKVGNTIGLYGSAAALVVLSYAGQDPAAAVIILIVAVGVNAGALVGYSPNHIDLSPNFASVLMGVANTAACIMCIIGPLLVGFIVTENDNEAQWRLVFLISAGFFILGNTLFIMFGSGEEQPWNNPEWLKSDHEDQNIDASCNTSNGKHVS